MYALNIVALVLGWIILGVVFWMLFIVSAVMAAEAFLYFWQHRTFRGFSDGWPP